MMFAKKEKFRAASEALGFWDEARLEVVGGDGGDGCLAFRREKGIPLGGPSGGNGGTGGSVILVCDSNINTLGVARRRTKYAAPSGKRGQGATKHARRAHDTYIRVPPGTIVREYDPPNRVAGELTEDGETMIVARGGRGGRGNAAFKTERLTAPRLAEHGENGARRIIKLELALVADVGIVGKPNAGKSTLLASCTRAKPKIADYAFTTLVPNLGVWEPPLKTRNNKNNKNVYHDDASLSATAIKNEAHVLPSQTRARRSRVGGLGKRQRAKLQKISSREYTGKKSKKKRRHLDEDIQFYALDDAPSTETLLPTYQYPRGAPVDAFAEHQLAMALGMTDSVQKQIKSVEEVSPLMQPASLSSASSEDSSGLVLADVPGLIENAHLGAGMGDAFLRHVERCRVLLHLVDATADDPIADLEAIEKELEAYSPTLANKQRIVCLNKADALQPESALALRQQLAQKIHQGKQDVVLGQSQLPPLISAATGEHVESLMFTLRQLVLTDKRRQQGDVPTKLHQVQVDFDPPFINSRDNPDRSWSLEDGRDTGYDGQWRIESTRLEKIASMTNFEQPDAVARFGRVLQALGVADALQDRGAQIGDLVMIGDDIDLEYDPIGWSPFEQLGRNAMMTEDDFHNEEAGDFELDDAELLPYFSSSFDDDDLNVPDEASLVASFQFADDE